MTILSCFFCLFIYLLIRVLGCGTFFLHLIICSWVCLLSVCLLFFLVFFVFDCDDFVCFDLFLFELVLFRFVSFGFVGFCVFLSSCALSPLHPIPFFPPLSSVKTRGFIHQSKKAGRKYDRGCRTTNDDKSIIYDYIYWKPSLSRPWLPPGTGESQYMKLTVVHIIIQYVQQHSTIPRLSRCMLHLGIT